MSIKPHSHSLPQMDTASVRKVSAVMTYLCLGLACAVPLVPLLAAVLFTTGFVPKWDPVAQQPLQLWAKVVLAVFKVLPMVFLVIGLWRVRTCFKRFANGEFFTAAAVRSLRDFSAWTGASALTSLIGTLVFGVLMNSVHLQQVALSFAYSSEWLMLFFAGTVWVMAGLIGHGRSLAEENAAFV